MKILIAGLGSIGRRHLRNLVSLGERDIILYRTHQSSLPEEELNEFPVVNDLGLAMAHHPDAVIISNPTSLHLDVALPAAEAGCHLLIEKPVAEKLDDRVLKLQKVVNDQRIKTLVGFQFRFHPLLARIRDVLTAGQLGRPLSFRVHWGEYLPDWHPWEDYRNSYAARRDLGGGVVNTLCHPLDYVRWLFGEIESINAITGKVSDLDLEVEDVAEITLKLESGCIGSIHLDYFQRPPAHWLEIVCENGFVRWENDPGHAKVYSVYDIKWQLIELPEGFKRNDLFLDEMKHFLSLLRSDVASQCDLNDGIKTIQATEAIHQSNGQNSVMIVL